VSRQEIDDYLAGVPAGQREALEDLRATLRDLLPEAAEGLSYGIPAFRLPDGPAVAGFAAFKKHLGYYPHSGQVIAALSEELADFSTSAGTIRFTPERPLPDALVEMLVATRLSQIAAAT